MSMTGDEIGMEAALAEQLDDIATEMNGLAEQLRRKPYAAVEAQVEVQYGRFTNLRKAGRLLKSGQVNLAQGLIRSVAGLVYED